MTSEYEIFGGEPELLAAVHTYVAAGSLLANCSCIILAWA